MRHDRRTFSELLRIGRISSGLTQEQLAEASGVSVRTIRNLERGMAGVPRQQSVRLLTDALDLPEPAREGLLTAAVALRLAQRTSPVEGEGGGEGVTVVLCKLDCPRRRGG